MLSVSLFVSAMLFGSILGVIHSLFDFLFVVLNIDATTSLCSKVKVNPIKKKILIFILDFLYFVIVTPFCAVYLFAANKGIIRWYIVILVVVGFLIYKYTVGRVLMCVMKRIMDLVVKIIKRLAKRKSRAKK